MSSVKENYALLSYNTFQVAANARYFVELGDIQSVIGFIKSDLSRQFPCFILGGGSNVLFTGDFKGTIVHPVIRGIEKTHEDDDHVIIRAGAGEEWDGLVACCVKNNWGGIENLSWIPGHVGACPVQNIGAYGVEIMDYIHTVEGFMMENGKNILLTAKECKFSYRDSIFKNELKDKVLITHVNFRLNKDPLYNTGYPDLQKEMDGYADTTIQNIRQAIIKIRKYKLPDPSETGNAGSFFKNPIIPEKQADDLHNFYPVMPVYKLPKGFVKLSAAWLIEQSGWKGKICGNVATHHKQPLIIINRGGATGKEILQCALKIRKSVMNNFAIKLEMEVNIL